MSNVIIFENSEFGSIRGLEIDGEAWLVGKDVAAGLGYRNPNDALAKHVDDEDKDIAKCDTLGGTQKLTIINESGLCSLAFSSKLPRAKEFQSWVLNDVLPQLHMGLNNADTTLKSSVSDDITTENGENTEEKVNNKSNITLYENSEFGSIRVVEINGEAWLVGKDVAMILGYAKPENAIAAHVDDEDKGVTKIRTPGGIQQVIIINESGLYSLALSSKLPGAKKFRRWVTSEVLPSIKKNGGYIVGQESMTPEELMAKALIVAHQTIENQKARLSVLTTENQIMSPKAEYFDALVDRNLLTNFRDTAKELHTGQKSFVSFLLRKKYIYRNKNGKLLPYQKHVDNGLFEIKEVANNESGWAGTQTFITPKGRETFRLLLTV